MVLPESTLYGILYFVIIEFQFKAVVAANDAIENPSESILFVTFELFWNFSIFPVFRIRFLPPIDMPSGVHPTEYDVVDVLSV